MASPTIIEGNLYCRGEISSQSMDIPSGTVTNADVSASAAIASTKLGHRNQLLFADGSAVTAATGSRIIGIVQGTAGSILEIRASAITANRSGAVVALDLHKNGSTVLSGTFELNDTQADLAVVDGTSSISSSVLARGDVLEVVLTATIGGGTLALGGAVVVSIDEDAA